LFVQKKKFQKGGAVAVNSVAAAPLTSNQPAPNLHCRN